MWFGASAVDPSSAEVAGDVRAPVANHSSIATRSYVCPSSTQKTGSFMISQVIGQHLRGWCRVDGVTSACLEGRRGEQGANERLLEFHVRVRVHTKPGLRRESRGDGYEFDAEPRRWA